MIASSAGSSCVGPTDVVSGSSPMPGYVEIAWRASVGIRALSAARRHRDGLSVEFACGRIRFWT